MPGKLVEDVIREKLTGETQKSTLDFVAYLRDAGISFNANEGEEGWAVGGTVGDSIGYMMVNGDEQFPGPWTIWFNSCDFNSDDTVEDALKETAWLHASPCGRCHDGWKDCGGGDRMIFGKAFENLCHSPLTFNNPDAQTLEHAKKLMLMIK